MSCKNCMNDYIPEHSKKQGVCIFCHYEEVVQENERLKKIINMAGGSPHAALTYVELLMPLRHEIERLKRDMGDMQALADSYRDKAEGKPFVLLEDVGMACQLAAMRKGIKEFIIKQHDTWPYHKFHDENPSVVCPLCGLEDLIINKSCPLEVVRWMLDEIWKNLIIYDKDNRWQVCNVCKGKNEIGKPLAHKPDCKYFKADQMFGEENKYEG